MAETTESNDAGTRRPLKIAAPLIAVFGAVSGAFVDGTASTTFAPPPSQGSGPALIPVAAVVAAIVGYLVGSRIDRRGYPADGGWRGLLLFVGTFVGLGSGMSLMASEAPVPPLAAAIVGCVGVFVGACAGARIGEAFDRRREITGESGDGDNRT